MLASLTSPALVLGGLLPGRGAMDVGEADASQAGKGIRARLTGATYGQELSVVTVNEHGGVGGVEDAFDSLLIAGKSFILIDNVRGKFSSAKIESFMTEDTYVARCSHSKNMLIDPRRTCLMLTSNKAEFGPIFRIVCHPKQTDAARRTCISDVPRRKYLRSCSGTSTTLPGGGVRCRAGLARRW